MPALRVRWLLSLFERVEEAVQFQAVEDHTGALRHGGQTWPPPGVKRLALDAYVHHRLGIVQAAFQHRTVLASHVAARRWHLPASRRVSRSSAHPKHSCSEHLRLRWICGCSSVARRWATVWWFVERSTLRGRLRWVQGLEQFAAGACHANRTFTSVPFRPQAATGERRFLSAAIALLRMGAHVFFPVRAHGARAVKEPR